MVDFRSLVHEQLSRLEPGSKSDLLRKYTCLLVFDFEAAARLQSWASFENLIIVCSMELCPLKMAVDVSKESRACNDPDVYSVMANIVINCEAPSDGRDHLGAWTLKPHAHDWQSSSLHCRSEP